MTTARKTPSKTTKKTSTGRTTPKKSNEPTSVSEWKKAKGLPLDLPSGKTALCRNPGMKAFLAAGLIPNSLIPLVTEALERGGSPSGGVSKAAKEAIDKKLTEQMKGDPKFLEEMMDAIDNITIYCVIKPPVRSDKWTEDDLAAELCTPAQVGRIIPEADRDERQLYIDEVDFDDKQHIFQWAVGGTRSLERFRK